MHLGLTQLHVFKVNALSEKGDQGILSRKERVVYFPWKKKKKQQTCQQCTGGEWGLRKLLDFMIRRLHRDFIASGSNEAKANFQGKWVAGNE